MTHTRSDTSSQSTHFVTAPGRFPHLARPGGAQRAVLVQGGVRGQVQRVRRQSQRPPADQVRQ